MAIEWRNDGWPAGQRGNARRRAQNNRIGELSQAAIEIMSKLMSVF